tara:strand:- start:2179 stop:2358 length:180 start_codon:yes stop_codon:yes gene_type:complete
MNKEQLMKDIQDWEREYLAMDVDLTKREMELLKGDPIRSHEGMMYGRMYGDWKIKKGYN